MSVINTQNNISSPQSKNNKVSLPKYVLGIAGGTAATWAAGLALNLSAMPYFDYYNKNVDKIYSNDEETIIQEADRMVKESKIGEKGFKDITLVKRNIFDEVLPVNIKSMKLSDIFKAVRNKTGSKPVIQNVENLDKSFINPNRLSVEEACNKYIANTLDTFGRGSFGAKSRLWFEVITDPFKKVSEFLTGTHVSSKTKLQGGVQTGVFDFVHNVIISGSPNSLLHEVGHAINKNKNFLLKVPQRLSGISLKVLMPLVVLNAIFTQKPEKNSNHNDKKETAFSKVRTFTRNNLALTIAGLWTPVIVEEIIATARAKKFASNSNIMNKNLIKQHNKCLNIAMGSYLFAMVVSSSLAQLSVFVKDKIIDYKPKNKKE